MRGRPRPQRRPKEMPFACFFSLALPLSYWGPMGVRPHPLPRTLAEVQGSLSGSSSLATTSMFTTPQDLTVAESSLATGGRFSCGHHPGDDRHQRERVARARRSPLACLSRVVVDG